MRCPSMLSLHGPARNEPTGCKIEGEAGMCLGLPLGWSVSNTRDLTVDGIQVRRVANTSGGAMAVPYVRRPSMTLTEVKMRPNRGQ